MTTWKIMLVVAIASAAAARADAKKVREPSKIDIATLDAKKYAFEAYPSWAAAHPDQLCPAKLEMLNEYASRKDIKDPWGHDFKMFCGKDLPAKARGLAVASAGPDGKMGTADDIKSWE